MENPRQEVLAPFEELPADLQPYMPLSKSIEIRRWMLGIFDGSHDQDEFLEAYPLPLPTDLALLPQARRDLEAGNPVYVGDSMTVRRCVSFLFRIFHLEPNVIFDKTMVGRPFHDDPDVASRHLEVLLDPDYDNTSQWATSAVLAGKSDSPPSDMSSKLKLTYQVRDEWLAAKRDGTALPHLADETLSRQALAYVNFLRTGIMDYQPTPGDGEDFCFLVAFGLMTLEDAASQMPTVTTHESNRVLAIQKAIDQANNNELVDSDDHRVIQAVAMSLGLGPERFMHPEAVAKSWPLFWEFREAAQSYFR